MCGSFPVIRIGHLVEAHSRRALDVTPRQPLILNLSQAKACINSIDKNKSEWDENIQREVLIQIRKIDPQSEIVRLDELPTWADFKSDKERGEAGVSEWMSYVYDFTEFYAKVDGNYYAVRFCVTVCLKLEHANADSNEVQKSKFWCRIWLLGSDSEGPAFDASKDTLTKSKDAAEAIAGAGFKPITLLYQDALLKETINDKVQQIVVQTGTKYTFTTVGNNSSDFGKLIHKLKQNEDITDDLGVNAATKKLFDVAEWADFLEIERHPTESLKVYVVDQPITQCHFENMRGDIGAFLKRETRDLFEYVGIAHDPSDLEKNLDLSSVPSLKISALSITEVARFN